MSRWAPALLALLALAPPAGAVDGVIEINQAAALAGGVTPGDAAGFPVTLTQSGSYRLTGNLSVSNPNANGIEVLADGVEVNIDLNGFEIAGPITCTGYGSALSCGAGTGRGIALYWNGNVSNGVVRNFGSDCAFTSGFGQFRDLRVSSCGLRGIYALSASSVSAYLTVGDGITGSNIEKSFSSSNKGVGIQAYAEVRDSTAQQNGAAGIHLSTGSTAIGCVTRYNESHGILAENGTTVSNNTAYQNGGRGISVGMAGTVTGNTVLGNSGEGIYLASGGTVSGNTVRNNTGDGIESAAGGTTVVHNAVENNTGWGFLGGAYDSVGGNTFNWNSSGGSGTATVIDCNTTNAVRTCPP